MRVRDAPFCHFILAKRIPMEAGLGGGSSDAVAALRALQHICGNPLEASEMAALAAELGSDCPLFLKDSPVIMRGRGESIAPLPTLAVERLRGRRVVVFKPAFGVPTGWAFRRMRGNPAIHYLPPATAERRLARAFHEEAELFPECLCFNSFEVPVFEKFVPLGVLARRLRARFELPLHLSGSGSACFLFPGQETSLGELQKIVQDCLGPTVFFIANRFS
jgi:4-diphosphocytidyl-2-C-methyl-D-erythritol kinase